MNKHIFYFWLVSNPFLPELCENQNESVLTARIVYFANNNIPKYDFCLLYQLRIRENGNTRISRLKCYVF